jgi:hypothetical protein
VEGVVLGIFVRWSGLLSNSWCATLNTSDAKPLLKLPNPLQNRKNMGRWGVITKCEKRKKRKWGNLGNGGIVV